MLPTQRTCAMTSHSHIPAIFSANPSPAYVRPLFLRPLGMDSGRGGPTAVGIGSRTSSVPGSRCGDALSSACRRAMGWSAGSEDGRGASGRDGAWGTETRRVYGEGVDDSASEGSMNHGRGEGDAVLVLVLGADVPKGVELNVRLAKSTRRRKAWPARFCTSLRSMGESRVAERTDGDRTPDIQLEEQFRVQSRRSRNWEARRRRRALEGRAWAGRHAAGRVN